MLRRAFATSAKTSTLMKSVQSCASAGDLESVILAAPAHTFDELTAAHCLSRMVELRSQSQPALDKLVSLAHTQLVFQPQELGECLRAFATRKLPSASSSSAAGLPQELLVQVEHSLPYLKAQGVCDALHAIAVLKGTTPSLDFFDAVAQEIVDRDLFMYFQRIGLVSCIVSLAKLNYVPAELVVERFTREVNARDVRKYTPTELVSLVHSLGKWGANLEPLMERLMRLDLASAQWKPQDVAQLLAGLQKHTVGQRGHAPLFAHIELALQGKDLAKLFPDNLVAVLGALASSTTAGAAKKSRYQLVARVVGELEQRDLAYLPCAQVVCAAQHLASLRFIAGDGSTSPLLMDKIGEQVRQRLANANDSSFSFSAQDLVELMRVFALYADKQIADDVAHALTSTTSTPTLLSFDDMVDVAFSFAVVDSLKHSHAVQSFFFQLAPEAQTSANAQVTAELLQLTKLAWSAASPKRSSPLLKSLDRARWSETQLEAASSASSSAAAKEATAQDAVAYGLLGDLLPDTTVLEYKTRLQGGDGSIAVDVLSRAGKLAIELERPSHMMMMMMSGDSEVRRQRTGEVQFRRRMLRQQGYAVFALPMRGFGLLSAQDQEQRVRDFCKHVTEAQADAASASKTSNRRRRVG